MGINKKKFIKFLCFCVFLAFQFNALNSNNIYVMGPATHREDALNSWYREGLRLYDMLKGSNKNICFFPAREHVSCWAWLKQRIPSKDFLTEFYRRKSIEGFGYELASLIVTTVKKSVQHQDGGGVLWHKVSIMTYGEGIRIVKRAIEILRSEYRPDTIRSMLGVLRIMEPSEEYLAIVDERDWDEEYFARRRFGLAGSSISSGPASTEPYSPSDVEEGGGDGAGVAGAVVAVDDGHEDGQQVEGEEENDQRSQASSDSVDSHVSIFNTSDLDDVFANVTVLSVPENYGRPWIMRMFRVDECLALGCVGCIVGCSAL